MSAVVQETRAAALENCRDFTIQGGTFNVSSTTVEQSPGDFRVVKLGDLNLLDEIDKQNVVEWHPVHRKKTGVVVRYLKVVVGTRRIYRAQIFGSQDPMTAVIYNDTQFEQVSHHVGNGYGLITASIHTVPVPLSELPEVKLTEYDLVACYPRGFPEFSRRTPKTIMLPSIYNPHWDRDSKPNDLHAIPTEKHLTLDDLYIGSWYDMYKSDLPQEVLPTGWTRLDYSESYSCQFWTTVGFKDNIAPLKWWLSQNHYVRKHLQGAFNATELITRIYFDCTLKTDLDFTLRGTFIADAPTDKVYLFLFPPQVDVVDGQIIVTNPPDTEKYYWAFDPAGLNQLTHDIAEDFGPPTVKFRIDLWGGKWDEHDYDMVRNFHIAKGFDPYTQDAAITMGYPLIDIEEMKKLNPRFADETPMDSSDAEVEDGIYYSLGLC